MRNILISAFAALAACSTASASDLPARTAPPPPPVVAPIDDVTGFTMGPILSTLGPGVEVGYRATPYFGARANLTGWPLHVSFTTGGASYSGKVSFLSGGLLGDYYPFGGFFRLTAGAHISRDSIDVTAPPTNPITISGFTFTPAQIGTLTSNVRYNPVAPYLGLGAETPAMLDGHLVFSLDAGAMYQGRSKVTVTASAGGLAANYIAAEEATVKRYTDRLSFYPVVSLGAKYRF